MKNDEDKVHLCAFVWMYWLEMPFNHLLFDMPIEFFNCLRSYSKSRHEFPLNNTPFDYYFFIIIIGVSKTTEINCFIRWSIFFFPSTCWIISHVNNFSNTFKGVSSCAITSVIKCHISSHHNKLTLIWLKRTWFSIQFSLGFVMKWLWFYSCFVQMCAHRNEFIIWCALRMEVIVLAHRGTAKLIVRMIHGGCKWFIHFSGLIDQSSKQSVSKSQTHPFLSDQIQHGRLLLVEPMQSVCVYGSQCVTFRKEKKRK